MTLLGRRDGKGTDRESRHRRQELKEGAPKAQQRTYYYMDYSHATDVIKWRMYKIQHTIDDKLRNVGLLRSPRPLQPADPHAPAQELESQGYVCPQCKKAFSTLDANSLLDLYRESFFCDVCDSELQDNENEEDVKGSKDRTKRLVEQTTAIRDLLKRMDDVILPRCAFLAPGERARELTGANRFDVIKWLALNGPEGTVATEEVLGPNGVVRIELAGDDDEALMKAQREADAAEKRFVSFLAPSSHLLTFYSSAPGHKTSCRPGSPSRPSRATRRACSSSRSLARPSPRPRSPRTPSPTLEPSTTPMQRATSTRTTRAWTSRPRRRSRPRRTSSD